MNEIDHDSLATNLESLIVIFDEEIQPYSLELSQTLINQYKMSLQKEF